MAISFVLTLLLYQLWAYDVDLIDADTKAKKKKKKDTWKTLLLTINTKLNTGVNIQAGKLDLATSYVALL